LREGVFLQKLDGRGGGGGGDAGGRGGLGGGGGLGGAIKMNFHCIFEVTEFIELS
jgi:hypothetical protein